MCCSLSDDKMEEDMFKIGDYVAHYKEWQGVPLILLGHSMGSMVVRCFTKKYDDLLNLLVVCGSPSKNPGAKIGIALAAVQEKISGAHHVSRFLELLSLGSYSGKVCVRSVMRKILC